MSRNNEYFGVDEKYQPTDGKIVSQNQVEGYDARKRRMLRIGKFVIGAWLLWALFIFVIVIIIMVLIFTQFRSMFNIAGGMYDSAGDFTGNVSERQQQMWDEGIERQQQMRDEYQDFTTLMMGE